MYTGDVYKEYITDISLGEHTIEEIKIHEYEIYMQTVDTTGKVSIPSNTLTFKPSGELLPPNLLGIQFQCTVDFTRTVQ